MIVNASDQVSDLAVVEQQRNLEVENATLIFARLTPRGVASRYFFAHTCVTFVLFES